MRPVRHKSCILDYKGMFFDPYSLLGVTIDSSISDLKKSYYRLALVCHEDKGGCKDDMIAVHCAYKFVLNELSKINRTTTVADLEQSFNEFCLDQQEAIPKFQDIYADAFDLPKFNDHFHDNTDDMIPISDAGGYGYLMDSDSTCTTDYDSHVKGDLTNMFTSEIIPYKAPRFIESFNHVVDYTKLNEKITDFSDWSNDVLGMWDYKSAHTFITLNDEINGPNQTIEARIAERAEGIGFYYMHPRGQPSTYKA
jgi:FlaG/FlaF family flagellin (archaellin)